MSRGSYQVEELQMKQWAGSWESVSWRSGVGRPALAAIASEALRPWGSIRKEQLDTAVAACNDNGTMYCTRIQVVANRLYITDYRAIFFDRHYAPARIMLLLELLKRRSIPDLDLVVAAVDEPRVKTKVESREWSRMIQRYPAAKTLDPRDARTAVLPPPLFSSTVNRAHLDLPWADFSFFMPRRPHKLRTPPWSLPVSYTHLTLPTKA